MSWIKSIDLQQAGPSLKAKYARLTDKNGKLEINQLVGYFNYANRMVLGLGIALE